LVSQSPLDESIDNKSKVWIPNQRPHEAQLDDQKPIKSSRRPSRRRRSRKANKRYEKRQNHEKSKKTLKSVLPWINSP
jgi:hypothetical protein